MKTIAVVGLDLAKSLFQIHAIDTNGKVAVRRPLRRGEVLKFFGVLSPCRHRGRTAGRSWQPTEVGGFWIKPLYENVERGEKTLLMKGDAGAFASLHAHAEFEQIYVLEGSLYDDEKVLKVGMIRSTRRHARC
jgi:hypothetical protein